jgi:hypothetical protein
MTRDQTYMLDTNVFNDLLKQKISPSLFAGYDVIATRIWLDELKATPTEETRTEENRTSLLNVCEEVAPVPTLVEGEGCQAYWNDGTGRLQNMLARLETLDRKKDEGKNHRRLSYIHGEIGSLDCLTSENGERP